MHLGLWDIQASLSRPSRTFGFKMRSVAQVHQNRFSWLKRCRIDPSGGVPGALGEIVKSINFEPPGRGQNPRKGLLKVTSMTPLRGAELVHPLRMDCHYEWMAITSGGHYEWGGTISGNWAGCRVCEVL